MSVDPAMSAKQAAVARAAQEIQNGMMLGLGTGSTAELLFPILRQRLAEGWQLTAVATSERTAALAAAIGVPLLPLRHAVQVDLTIDGADEVDPALRLVKGRGGALLREKMVAQASRRAIIVVDDSKLVPTLGTRAPLPVEVVQFGWEAVSERLAALGASEVTLREQAGKPVLTDSGNYLLDCRFPGIADPEALDVAIHRIAGVVEHGLFLGLADTVIVGSADGSTAVLSQSKERL
ncbi:MAG: ribose-5-phosphate isomerase RpiA [Chloroflexota bacterium]|nr:ribose-5-phosphate isomerase RpiA [Dehalococcoidia bacterium]MDW8254430.1 ribose-5-phosphate isomerase RpiA [Chloroflexota bacterium]